MFGFFDWYRKWRESGSIIVLTAVVLPLMLACGGFAVDMGNLYVHKSRLQNAADAAALAGANTFKENKETVDSHPEADNAASAYADRNAITHNKLGGSISNKVYLAKQDADTGTIYYGVKLTENVPIYFMNYFLKKSYYEVNADAVAVVENKNGGGGGGGGSGGGPDPTGHDGGDAEGHPYDLFIFKDQFRTVNTINNPDNFGIPGQISSTFDGKITFTNGNGTDSSSYNPTYKEYSSQTQNLDFFMTQAARDQGLSVNDAKEAGLTHQMDYSNYDIEKLGETVRDLMGVPDYVSRSIDWSKPWSEIEPQQNAIREYANNSVFNAPKDMRSGDLSKNIARTANPDNGDGNVSITIDSAISGNTKDPVYIYLDESITQVNFNVNASNERPLVLIYEGTGNLQMNYANSGVTFKGIVYAPHVNPWEGVLLNVNGGTFMGSIISNFVNLRNDKGTYIYRDFFEDSHGSSGSGGDKPKDGGDSTDPDNGKKVKLTIKDDFWTM